MLLSIRRGWFVEGGVGVELVVKRFILIGGV